MTEFQFVGDQAQCAKIARRYAAIAMSEAYMAMGHTTTVATILAGREFGVSASTVRKWQRSIEGIARNDVAARVRYLSWHNFRRVKSSTDAR